MTSGHTFVIGKIGLRLVCLASLYILGCNLSVFKYYCYTLSSSESFGHFAVETALQMWKKCCELVAAYQGAVRASHSKREGEPGVEHGIKAGENSSLTNKEPGC